MTWQVIATLTASDIGNCQIFLHLWNGNLGQFWCSVTGQLRWIRRAHRSMSVSPLMFDGRGGRWQQLKKLIITVVVSHGVPQTFAVQSATRYSSAHDLGCPALSNRLFLLLSFSLFISLSLCLSLDLTLTGKRRLSVWFMLGFASDLSFGIQFPLKIYCSGYLGCQSSQWSASNVMVQLKTPALLPLFEINSTKSVFLPETS